MFQMMRILIISALISIYQIGKSEAAVSGKQPAFGIRYSLLQPFDSAVVSHNLTLTRDDSHPYPMGKQDTGSATPISNKYRSDKKEYRFVFIDRIHNRASIHVPVFDFPLSAFTPVAETRFPIGGEPETLPSTGRRE
jgi:hypothetical protein